MKLIAGLGNTGDGYSDTYHNVGFMALDELAERFRAPVFGKKNNALVTDAGSGDNKVILIKPLTYMNLSGDAVAYFSRYYKIAPRDILVMYDDIDIHKGTVRARLDGSAGTHNGMRDIVNKLGSTEFARVRIGTGLKPNFMALADYVLSHIHASERAVIDASITLACEFAADWAEGKAWDKLTATVNNA